MAEGVADTDEDLALEVIAEVGPGGHYLAAPHTLRHMRSQWRPRFFGREAWEDWEAAGRPQPPDRAWERALAIVAEHEPAPLQDGAEDAILGVIEAYERQGRKEPADGREDRGPARGAVRARRAGGRRLPGS